MKHNVYLHQQPDGQIICQWFDDPYRKQVIARPNEQGTYSPFEVTRLLADAYANGRRHAQDEMRRALGLKEIA